jgi:hypothetical protein
MDVHQLYALASARRWIRYVWLTRMHATHTPQDLLLRERYDTYTPWGYMLSEYPLADLSLGV